MNIELTDDQQYDVCKAVLIADYKRTLTQNECQPDELEQRIRAFHTLFGYYLTTKEQTALSEWRWQQIEIVVDKIPKVA